MPTKFNATEIAKTGLAKNSGPRKKVPVIGARTAGLPLLTNCTKPDTIRFCSKRVSTKTNSLAGEHAPLAHIWIQGAIESDLGAASEVDAA